MVEGVFTQSIIALHFELHMPVCAFIVGERKEGFVAVSVNQCLSLPGVLG